MKEVIIYTDGSAKGNPGKGGYGAVLISGNHEKRLSQGYILTTNNRMELLAVIIGLEALNQKCNVIIYSDSKYVVDSVEKEWVFGWEKKEFKGKKNTDLWKRFLSIYRNHNVKFKWVKGHAGNKYNEICDQLAVEAAESSNLLNDEGYKPN
ncbi:MAG: ribonuclease HI [Flavobacteriales bacterium]